MRSQPSEGDPFATWGDSPDAEDTGVYARVSSVGGTDKMSNDVPIGISRTYVRLDAADDFGFDSWCRGLKAGRSYMSSGPIFDLAVDGAGIGDTVRLPENGGTVNAMTLIEAILVRRAEQLEQVREALAAGGTWAGEVVERV